MEEGESGDVCVYIVSLTIIDYSIYYAVSLSGISQETSSSSSSINEPLEVTRHSRSRKRKKVNISQPLEFRSVCITNDDVIVI